MTVKDFYQLDEMEQGETVWSGVHIGNREDKDYGILLYSLDGGMYVEAYYHREYNVLTKFVAYSNRDDLMPFLGFYDNL
jgi:hypothetical protein